MGVAFSKGGITYVPSVTADSSAALRNAIDALLADWPSTAISGGKRYEATSPQGMKYHLDVWDDGSYEPGMGTYIKLQCRSLLGGFSGPECRLGFGVGYDYWLWANCCDFYAALSGVSEGSTYRYHAFHCGIPYVPDPPEGSVCDLTLDTTVFTEVWWCAGVDHPQTLNFRNSVSCYSRDVPVSPVFGVCVNGSGWTSADYAALWHADKSALRLLPWCPSHAVTLTFNARPHLRTGPGTAADFVCWNPLVAWAPGPTESVRVVGQCYDAVLVSDWRDIDDVLDLGDEGHQFKVYGYGAARDIPTYGGCLALLLAEPVSVGLANIVY